MASSSWTHSRSALALAVQRGEPPETVARLRRDYAAARAEHYLSQLVQRDPPLTAAQFGRLETILATGRGHAAT